MESIHFIDETNGTKDVNLAMTLMTMMKTNKQTDKQINKQTKETNKTF